MSNRQMTHLAKTCNSAECKNPYCMINVSIGDKVHRNCKDISCYKTLGGNWYIDFYANGKMNKYILNSVKLFELRIYYKEDGWSFSNKYQWEFFS